MCLPSLLSLKDPNIESRFSRIQTLEVLPGEKERKRPPQRPYSQGEVPQVILDHFSPEKSPCDADLALVAYEV